MMGKKRSDGKPKAPAKATVSAASMPPRSQSSERHLERPRNTVSVDADDSARPEVDRGANSDQSNILVAVRQRPLHEKEVQQGIRNIVRVMDDHMILLMDPSLTGQEDVLRANRSKEKRYAFDVAFDENCSTEQVYLRTTKHLIDGVLQVSALVTMRDR
eukprot:GHVU01093535.1.p1 GENE.GHVU01093535.1~~GHVU01093535.1.p1  ORF type:complete len:159 (+),score=14.84 GHVU01093535.1:339-815(+)